MVLILGCGYTGQRVAAAFNNSKYDVVTTSRQAQPPELRFELRDADSFRNLLPFISNQTRVLYSIPDVSAEVLDLLAPAKRVVYLSTTGVYGNLSVVNAESPIDAAHPRAAAEHQIQTLPSALVLRPAAIYGPGRGIQNSMLAGTFKLAGDGSNYVSRIHVDDLASHCVAGLFSEVIGAFPVGDEEPCPSKEIAAFCASLLNVPMPPHARPEEMDRTRQANRRVDGGEIRRLLAIQLRYPTYRLGIPASIERAR